MSTTTTLGETNPIEIDNPGMQLASLRQQKGYTLEYVASKLHLRVRVIELIEADDFQALPEAVFVKGYLRAYAKLLGIAPEPFLSVFNNQHSFERKPERALWQSKRETHKAESIIRLVTILFALAVLVAVGVWWQKNKDAQPFSTAETTQHLSINEDTAEIRLTDLSKMQSILTPESQMSPLEKEGG